MSPTTSPSVRCHLPHHPACDATYHNTQRAMTPTTTPSLRCHLPQHPACDATYHITQRAMSPTTSPSLRCHLPQHPVCDATYHNTQRAMPPTTTPSVRCHHDSSDLIAILHVHHPPIKPASRACSLGFAQGLGTRLVPGHVRGLIAVHCQFGIPFPVCGTLLGRFTVGEVS
jgi:hypothetical protein